MSGPEFEMGGLPSADFLLDIECEAVSNGLTLASIEREIVGVLTRQLGFVRPMMEATQ
jgi:hypothetical protein